MTFVFENHDGASLVPEICREVLERVDRPNIRMNFDPINFERAGVDAAAALAAVRPFVAHVHLKGLERGEFCEFGTGDVDLTPVLQRLVGQGYAGDFTVEYEGPFDGTLRLYQSVERAPAPGAQLLAQRLQRLPFTRIDRGIVEAVDDGELQVGHPSPGIERQERAIAVQGHDVDAAQMLDDGAVHHDQRSPVGNRHQFDVRLGVGLAADARAGDFSNSVTIAQPTSGSIFRSPRTTSSGQRQRDHLAGTSELRRPSAPAW